MMRTMMIILAVASLTACQETWKGVKKDTKTITKSVGDAGNHLGKQIGKALNGDEKEGEE